MRRLSHLAGLLFSVAALAPAAAAAADRPAMAIAFDSSNSMWSQIDGANKVVMLRELLGERFRQASGKLDLAVLTFGTREENACSAVDTVMPLGPLAPDDYAAAIARVTPGHGATPLARVLREAAAAVAYESRPATLVVIADGLDNCRTDPCATAAELKAKAPGLAIHVIAFGSKHGEELGGLACMASETGGKFFQATSRAELDAALGETFSLAAAHGAGVAAAAKTDRAAKGDRSTPPAQKPSAAKGAEKTPDAAARPAGKAGEAVPLPPVKTEQQPSPGQPPQAAAASPAAGPAAPSAPAAPPPAATATPAELVARQAAEEQPTGAANLRLRAALTEEAPQQPLGGDLVWRVFSARPDVNGSFKVIARSTEANPVFRLASGRYVVHVAYGRATTTREIEIADRDKDETIVLNAGFMRLAARGPDGEELGENKVSFSVYSAEQDQFGERKLVQSAIEPGRIVRLNAGAYQIVSQYGDANAVARGDVKVEAGKLAEVSVSHTAAMVTLKLVHEPGGEALADTSWSVLTPQGDIVAESVGAFPSHILAAGEYSVVARHDGKAYSKEFAVESGLDREIEIVAGPEEGGGE